MEEKVNALGTPMTPDEYSAEWAIEAEHIEKTGCYEWMASQLGTQKIVLEVGCGQGRSTHALAKRSKVVCVESNLHMAQACKMHLKQKKISANLLTTADLANIKLTEIDQVTIIVGDIFGASIEDFVTSLQPTAITCWLIGANPQLIADHLGIELSSFGAPHMRRYRTNTHHRCYELGAKSLAQGGVVQIVDRIVIQSWAHKTESRQELLAMHLGLSKNDYEIPIESVYFRKFDHSFGKSEIHLISEGNPKGMTAVLSSVRASRGASGNYKA